MTDTTAKPEGRVRPATRGERGQALVVIAMAMIGLLAFVGLTVDAGILFIAEGHLRRAVDAAALAAASQFRQGADTHKLFDSAAEVVRLNGVDAATLTMGICNDPNYPDASLCPTDPNAPHRKLVKVTASSMVTFAFLGIIGIPNTTIQADSVSETASVDVVLVIDTSNSMTYDAASGDPNRDPAICNAVNTPADPTDLDPSTPYTGSCHPFNEVKHAAVNFIHHLFHPYDRLAIVTFDNIPTPVQPLTNTLQPADWERTLKGLTVSPPRDAGYPGSPCDYHAQQYLPSPPNPANTPDPLYQPDPANCTNTSTGGGLRLAGSEFGRHPIRQEAVWVVILLTDGAANASVPDPAHPLVLNSTCPNTTWWDPTADPNLYRPFCRDYDPTTRHTVIDPAKYNTALFDPGHTSTYNPKNVYDKPHYDADDYARDNADFVACSASYAQAAKYCRDSLDYTTTPPEGGQGALIYAIGLGKLVIDNSQGGGVMDASAHNGEARINPSDTRAGYAAGDTLLRYIGRVGGSGDPNSPDPCAPVAPPTLIVQPDPGAPTLSAGNLSYNCGNYYFSQFGTGLTAVFQSIASRIFTRITQ